MDEQAIETRLSFRDYVRIAFGALSTKVMRWAGMLMSFALFGAAVWWPNPWRLAGASGFTLYLIVLLLRKER